MAAKSPHPPALVVIPARFASTRFPGKPLADRTGQPLIQHVCQRVAQARTIGRIIVATDDQRIFDAVKAFGGEAMMTREDHPNGTSRIAEVVQHLASVPGGSVPGGSVPGDGIPGDGIPGVIVNVQGDEPEIEPAVIDQLVEALQRDSRAPMATLASPFADDEDPADPNIVKIVVTACEPCRAIYFSRSLIPFPRDAAGKPGRAGNWLKHPGLYAYRPDFLLRYVALAATPLEQAEKLEQLRALEHGYPIAVVRTAVRHHGIDTPQQYEEFVRRWKNGQGW